MFDVAESLRAGFASAGARLRDAQAAVAEANAGHRSRATDAAMAQAARAALFNEALLGATHERLNEIKSVTK